MNLSRVFSSNHSNKHLFKKACDRYDLVYFGTVSQHTDEHEMVRGFTLSPSHVDRHYCVGTVSGRDVILLERTDTISYPDIPSRAHTWLILQIDLARPVPTHIIMNTHSYDKTVYSYLLTKFHDIREYDQMTFADYNGKFTSTFRTFASPQHVDDVLRIINTETASVLGHHFGQFDYEVYHDELMLYLPLGSLTDQHVEHILKAGIWLAGEIDAVTLLDATV